MVIDGKVIESVKNADGEYDEFKLANLLATIITTHREPKNAEYDKAWKYYRGEHDILKRTRKSSGVANNKAVCNFPKYITEMTTAFIVGNPVTYSVANEIDISAINEIYVKNDMSTMDAELEKSMSIYGKAYELIYADEKSRPRSCVIDVRNAFVCYTDTATYTPIFGVHYYKRYDVENFCIGIVCNVYTDAEVITFEYNTENWAAMRITERIPHYFGIVPLIEYRNNKAEMGDFTDVISLIDSYNLLQSDRINDKEQFVDAFLFLTGCDVDSEQAKKLREERILMGYEGADAKYLSKVLSEADTEILRNSLREDILMFAMVPDMSNDKFGTQISGVAMRYKILSILQHIADKERYFCKGLRRRLEGYNNYLALRGTMGAVDTELIQIVFTPNIPANTLETAQIIELLTGKVSDKTLISQLEFVNDPEAEIEAVKKQVSETEAVRAEANRELLEGGGF